MTSNRTVSNDEPLRKDFQEVFGDAGSNVNRVLTSFFVGGILGIFFGFINMTFTAFFATISIIIIALFALLSFDRKIKDPIVVYSFVGGLGFELGRFIGFFIQIITNNIAATMWITLIAVGIYVWTKQRTRS